MANKKLMAKALLYKADNDSEKEKLLSNVHFLNAAGISTDEAKLLLSGEKDKISDFTTKRGLTLSDSLEGTSYTLIQEEVYDTVIAGTEPTKIFRDIIPIVNMDTGYALRVPKGSAGRYAPKVPEGSPIPMNNQSYDKVDISIDKYGERPVITREYIDDNLFDIVDLELKKLGMSLENALNRAVLTQLTTGLTGISPFSPASTNFDIKAIATGRSKVLKKNRYPDRIITHPTAEMYLLQDSNLAYVSYAGQSKTLETGQIPTIFGLTPTTCTATDSDTAPVWDDTSAGSDYTAMILDTMAPAAMVAMKKDIDIEQYNDPISDLVGMAGTMRFGADVVNNDAGVLIYHK